MLSIYHEKTAWNTKRTWAEISISALYHNIQVIRDIVGPDRRIACVVKADAYGHGVAIIAPALERAGLDFFIVATLDEAIELRELGIRSDILILAATHPRYVPEIKAHNLIQTIAGPSFIDAYAKASAKTGGAPLRLHANVDSGMTRLGFSTDPDDIQNSAEQVISIILEPSLELEGLYTHLATGYENKPYAEKQYARYRDFLSRVEGYLGDKPLLRHVTASGALGYPGMDCDMARPGILMYGGRAEPRERYESLRPVMTLKSRISMIRTCPQGTPVSYGCTWKAPRDSVLAVVTAGYADGVRRQLSNRAHVIIRGRQAPIAGRVCMDSTLVDITDIPEAQEGDDVLIFGESDGVTLRGAEVAALADTIDYELFCGVSGRVPRIQTD